MKKQDNWQIKDIINLEYLLKRDEGEQKSAFLQDTAKRDREIYLLYIRPLENRETGLLSRKKVLLHWLKKRIEFEKKEKGEHALLPGDVFLEIYLLLKYGLLVTGFIVGSSIAFSFLTYRGTEPINVAAYLGGFVLPQLFLLLLLLTISLIRRIKNQPLQSSIIFIFLSNLIRRLFQKIWKNRWGDLSSIQRDSLEAVMGVVRGKRVVYGSLFYWPIFILSQIFMIAFNMGLLCATIFKVIGADVAFGWQSTIQVSYGFVFKLAGWIALPWSWLVPSDLAYPSLTQIQGSHMILKDGIYHLETANLISWWPFLCLAVLFYGLLPRLFLLAIGVAWEKRRINTITFDHEPCESLYRRMQTPIIDTRGCPDEKAVSQTSNSGDQVKVMGKKKTESSKRTLLLLIPDEIRDTITENSLRDMILKTTGYSVINIMVIDETEAMTGDILKDFSLSDTIGRDRDLMIIQEAWQPPIREILGYIKKLGDTLGGRCVIMVGLIGKGGKDGIPDRVMNREYSVWDKKIKSLGNPYISLIRLESNVG